MFRLSLFLQCFCSSSEYPCGAPLFINIWIMRSISESICSSVVLHVETLYSSLPHSVSVDEDTSQ